MAQYSMFHKWALYVSAVWYSLLSHLTAMCCHVCRLNAAEMFVDVSREGDGTSTNWVAESGVLDLFLLLGQTPRQVSTDLRVQ